MGIPADTLGDLQNVEVRRGGVTLDETQKLGREGLEVDKEDVILLDDCTLSYKNRRVLVYIRDVSQYGDRVFDPKFHFSDCRTLQQMRRDLRFARYVIATRDDGLFRLQYIGSGRWADRSLDVCQNCLDRLTYKGFQRGMQPHARRKAVDGFSIIEFFELYPKTLHRVIPAYSDQTAPTNDYNPGFALRSDAARRARNWTCETCSISLSDISMHRYLHIHHKNGQKYDDAETNWKAVCLHCHCGGAGA
jgi:hypothetical protein